MAIFTRPREEIGDAAPDTPSSGNGYAGRRERRPPGGGRLRRHWRWPALAVVVVAGLLVGAEAAGTTATYPVKAVFAQAPGLFPGAAVEVLGVPVGTVTSVRNVGDEVLVGLAIDRGHPVPAGAEASLVSPEILGEPSIELAPGYTGGQAMRSGATIPLSRTAVPVSTERVLKSLEAMLKKVNPHAVGHLVTNLANDLQGQGKNLNRLIAGAAGTLKVLATKADDLGQLSGSLAQLTGTLDSRTSQITQLITDYDTVSGVIATHSTQLGGAITQLSEASTQLVQLLVPDLGPVESDVGSVTRVGRTLDRNLASVDQTLSAATALFSGAERAYTPTYNWLTLNAQLPTGLTGALLAAQVEHRLEGVCRRVLAHHAGGLTAKQRQTLATCGSRTSAFFGPVVSQIPTVLNDVRAGKLPTASPAQIFKKGLAKIPGVPGAATPGQSGSRPGSGSTSGGRSTTSGSSKGSGTSTTPTTPGTTKTKAKTKKTCLGGLLGTTITCTTGSSQTSTSPGSGSGGGLLAYHAPAANAAASGVSTGAAGEGSPTLMVAGTRDLPPLPASAPGASRPGTHHRPSHHHGKRSGRTRRRAAGATRGGPSRSQRGGRS